MKADPYVWLPFGILPTCVEEGRLEPEVVEMRLPDHGDVLDFNLWVRAFENETVETVQSWRCDDIMKNFALRAAVLYLGLTPAGAESFDDLVRTANLLRAQADRLPIQDDALRTQMLSLADRLERDRGWLGSRDDRALFFGDTVPLVGTQKYQEWALSLHLWGAWTLLRRLTIIEKEYAAVRRSQHYWTMTSADFWVRMTSWLPKDRYDPSFAVYKQAEQRVSRFAKKILQNRADAIMILLLADIFRHGPLFPTAVP